MHSIFDVRISATTELAALQRFKNIPRILIMMEMLSPLLLGCF